MSSFVLVIKATLCHTSLIHVLGLARWSCVSCGLRFPAHGHRFDSTGTPRFASALRGGSFVVMGVAAHVCLGCFLPSWNMCARQLFGSFFSGSSQQQGERKSVRGSARNPRHPGLRSVGRANTQLNCFRSRPIVAAHIVCSQGTSWTSSVAATPPWVSKLKNINLYCVSLHHYVTLRQHTIVRLRLRGLGRQHMKSNANLEQSGVLQILA